jgi:ferredoxin/predicted CopG family antitoxin
MTDEEKTISVNQKAHERLTWARKKGEDYSDVIIRLTSTKLEGLQRRGEKEIVTSDGRRLVLKIEQGKCLGAESCVLMAPQVFALDMSNLGLARKGEEPLGMKDLMEGEVDSETVIRGAKSCPYQAIYVMDADSGEEICPV